MLGARQNRLLERSVDGHGNRFAPTKFHDGPHKVTLWIFTTQTSVFRRTSQSLLQHNAMLVGLLCVGIVKYLGWGGVRLDVSLPKHMGSPLIR